MVEGFADLAIDAQILLDSASALNDEVIRLRLDTTPTDELYAVRDIIEAAYSYLTAGRAKYVEKLAQAENGNPLDFG